MKPISKCSAGDMIQAKDGSKAKVLGRLGVLIFRSEWYQPEVASYRPITIQEAQKEGWKVLMGGKEVIEVKEAEHILNVRIIRNKTKK